MFKRELLFTEYGYGSLIDMCIALKHIFHYVRPGNDDFMLYDRSKPLPVTATKSYTISSYDPGLNQVSFCSKLGTVKFRLFSDCCFDRSGLAATRLVRFQRTNTS